MHEAPFLTELVLLLAAAAAGAVLFERLRLPSIAGFLLVGAAVGPGGAGLVSDPVAVQRVAEFGVVFLLFEIGLELPVERLRHLMRSGLAAGALQVAGTLGCVALGALALGLPLGQALVFGALIAMSSTALVIRMLSSRGELDSPYGQISVAILLFQDLCIVPFLLAVPLLAAPQAVAIWPVLGALLKLLLALFLFFVAVRFAVPRLLAGAAGLRSREVFSLAAVGVVVGSAVAAEKLGLTLAVGAFLVGLVARSSPYGPQLFSEVVPLRGVLLGIFFTAIGMLLDLRFALANLGAVLLMTLVVLLGKTLLVMTAVRVALPKAPALAVRAGLALAQTGEFSFVLAVSAAAHGLLDTALLRLFIASSVLSLMASPFLIRAGPRLQALFGEGKPQAADARAPLPAIGHVVLVGFGLAGRNLARVLDGIGVRWLAVESNPGALREPAPRGGRLVYGDATRTGLLQHLGVERARLVVVAINDPVATRRVVTLVRGLAPEVPILARTRYVLEVDALHEAGAQRVVAEELEGTIDLVSQVLRNFEVPTGAVARFAEELRDEGYALLQAPPALGLDPWLAELLEQRDTEWVEVAAELRDALTLRELLQSPQGAVSVLALQRAGVTTANPEPALVLQSGDRLLIFAGSAALAQVRERLGGA